MSRPKLTEEERRIKQREANRRSYQKHREKRLEYQKEYNQANKEKKAAYNAEYNKANKEKRAEYSKTPMGRACNIVNAYKTEDKKYNRGKCTITPVWIIDNIFPMPCHYCGAMGWEIMGCDRVDNSLPHTPDNVVPCCAECNRKRGLKSYEEFKASL